MKNTDIIIEVKDKDGTVIGYAFSQAAAAEMLDCSRYAIQKGLKNNSLIKGCKVRYVDSVTLQEALI